jgi:hypothetical protein
MTKIGFLSPNGEFIECKYTEHSMVADKILKTLNIFSENPEQDIAQLGWMFFQNNFAGIPITGNNIPLTELQITWIIINYEALNKKQKYFISEKLKKDNLCKNNRYPSYLTEVNWSGLI